jgi:hypothetical protein
MSDPAAAKEIAALWEYIDTRTEADPSEAEVLPSLENLISVGSAES